MGAALSTNAPLLLYDGVCPLCNGAVRFLLAVDRQGVIRFAPLQGTTARTILGRHSAAADADSLILVESAGTPDETLFLRSEALLRLLLHLGGLWQALRPFAFLPRSIPDTIYSMIARNRYRWFGRYDACPLPPPHQRDRFLP